LLEHLSFNDYALTLVVSYFPTLPARHFCAEFYDVVAWHVVNESFSVPHSDEQSELDGPFEVFRASPYLSWVKSRYGLYEAVWGAANHYRLWTETKVVDVVACIQPTVKAHEGDAELRPNNTLETDV
jgi:hypothetical protein